MSSELEKMIRGEMYVASDPELHEMRVRARRLTRTYNGLDPADETGKLAIIGDLLGRVPPNVQIEAPFICEYGAQIFLGERVFINFNCVFLDCSTITIGDDTQIAPSVQLYTATHPIDAAKRVSGLEYAQPITIGSRVWIGGGSIVLPGVTIGDDCVIGAGSVVTRSLPAGVLAVGNPCREIRKAVAD